MNAARTLHIISLLYYMLCTCRCTNVPSLILLFSLFQLVGGEFDLESNFIIDSPENVEHMLELMETCEPTLQGELWSHFTAILRKSTRNLQACTEVSLIEKALGRLSQCDDMQAGEWEGLGDKKYVLESW